MTQLIRQFNALNHQLLQMDAVAVVWRVADVREIRPDLSIAQSRQVLEAISQDNVAGFGIGWNTLSEVADELFGESQFANAA